MRTAATRRGRGSDSSELIHVSNSPGVHAVLIRGPRRGAPRPFGIPRQKAPADCRPCRPCRPSRGRRGQGDRRDRRFRFHSSEVNQLAYDARSPAHRAPGRTRRAAAAPRRSGASRRSELAERSGVLWGFPDASGPSSSNDADDAVQQLASSASNPPSQRDRADRFGDRERLEGHLVRLGTVAVVGAAGTRPQASRAPAQRPLPRRRSRPSAATPAARRSVNALERGRDGVEQRAEQPGADTLEVAPDQLLLTPRGARDHGLARRAARGRAGPAASATAAMPVVMTGRIASKIISSSSE